MKYDKETLEKAVRKSKSVAQVLRALGTKQAGGTHSYISKRIKEFKIDTSHFTGQGWNKGNISNQRRLAKDILVYRENRREKSHLLTRAMMEMGVQRKCVECGIGIMYNYKKLTLHVDHKNGDWRDNILDNLRFLCPNCHSQTDSFGSKNVGE